MRVGLTGGVGSGKSAVARLFSGWGALVIDADVLARDVVAPNTPAFAAIAAAWPQTITAQGSLDRAALARLVFADDAARERLGAIVHPRVRDRAAAIEAAAPAGTLAVHVVPLLFEGDYWKTCDRTVLVEAPRDVRIARVMARDGLSAAHIEARMAAQIDPQRARAMADEIINNNGDMATLAVRAGAVFKRLQTGAVR